MAENKKSFVMYADWIHSIKYLTDEQSGKLLKHLLSYVNDEDPVTDDPIINITFEPIKQQLKRDLEKWDIIRFKRSEAGKKSALKRAEQKSTSVESVKQTSTNPTVNDNVNVNVNVNVNDTNIFLEKKEKFILWFNQQKKIKTGRKGTIKVMSKTDDNNLKQLFKGYKIEDFQIALDNMYKNDWAVENKMCNIAHFLRIDNFNKYIAQGEKKKVKPIKNLYD